MEATIWVPGMTFSINNFVIQKCDNFYTCLNM